MIRWLSVMAVFAASLYLGGCNNGEDIGNPEGTVATTPESAPSYVLVRRDPYGQTDYSEMDRRWEREELRRRQQELEWRRMDQPRVINRGRGYPERLQRSDLYFVEDPSTFVGDGEGDGYRPAKRWRRYHRRSYPRRYHRYQHHYPQWSPSYVDYYSWYYSYNWMYQPAYYWNTGFYYYSPCSSWTVYTWRGYSYYCYYLDGQGWY